MKSRNDEIERDPDAEFDYEDFEIEHGEVIEVENPYEDFEIEHGEVIEVENPYDDYEIWDVEIREVAIKKVAVFAKDADTARELIESKLDSIDMTDIDEYHKTVEVMGNDGSSVADYTVPLEWYQEEDEEE